MSMTLEACDCFFVSCAIFTDLQFTRETLDFSVFSVEANTFTIHKHNIPTAVHKCVVSTNNVASLTKVYSALF